MISGQDSSATPGPDTTAVPRAVGREALAGDVADADLAAEAVDHGTAGRDHETPGEGQAASDADETASERDDRARRRERRAILVEEAIAGSAAPGAEKVARLREQAAHDRAGAAEDRERAAEERTEATAERARLEAGLHGAYLDDLTGAFRREVGRHALALEVDRARQADGRFVLACIDVDGLGGINDRAGHATGDHVLRTLVAIMRSGLRSYDPIVRMGGDDFACGIGGVGLDEVDLLFYEVERSLHADTGAGISVGTAALSDGETIEQITARADAALLDARGSRPA
jgi:diguanylate cyclase (GGDEF)-like protein